MLPPEVEEGNNEYKCYFKDIKKDRFVGLSTQMNWRLNEGNGICYYYIGINDDGTIYNKLTKKQIKYSLSILTQLVKFNKSIITNKEKNIEDEKTWFKIEIKRQNIAIKYKEYRILLLGNSQTGKSTFIANLIKKKLDKDGIGKYYTFNHKHELVSGETSSISYFCLTYQNTNFLFFDSPGNSKYVSTLSKLIQSIDYNLVLYFPNFDNSEWEYKNIFFEYFSLLKIPIITLNLNTNISNYPDINMKQLIEKEKFISYLKNNIVETENKLELRFNIMNTYFNNDLGILLSGYLVSGKIEKNQILYWYLNERIKIKIISIRNVNTNVNSIEGPSTITLRIKILDTKNSYNIKNLKYGFVTNNKNINIINSIKINWNYELDNKNEIICNSINSKLILKLQDNNTYISCNHFKLREYLSKQYIICLSDKNIGLINFDL